MSARRGRLVYASWTFVSRLKCRLTGWTRFATDEIEASGVSVFHLAECRQEDRLPAGKGGRQVAFAPCGQLLAYVGWSEPGRSRVDLWNLEARQRVAQLSFARLCRGLASSNEGSMIALILTLQLTEVKDRQALHIAYYLADELRLSAL